MRAITERDVLSSLGQAIRKLRWTILHGEVERTGDSPVLIFICGANKPNGGGLSERRQAVIRFLETSIQNVSIVIAEHFFDALLNDINHQINLLDAEHFLTKISDDVIIILVIRIGSKIQCEEHRILWCAFHGGVCRYSDLRRAKSCIA